MGITEPGSIEHQPSGARKELLLKMYDQLFNDINRHILVIWQSVGVVIGAFALFALAEKNVITVDVTVSLIILLAGWLVAHIYDSSYWYNRNLVIIANIEKQFLQQDDLRNIHYYFGKHRPRNRMISHLRIQYHLAAGLAGIVLLFHFITRIAPGIHFDWYSFDAQRALPYIVLIFLFFYLRNTSRRNDIGYQEFLTNSPGIEVSTEGIQYGVGHGFRTGEANHTTR